VTYVSVVFGFIFLALFAVEKMKVSQSFSGRFIIFFLVLFKCTPGGGKKRKHPQQLGYRGNRGINPT